LLYGTITSKTRERVSQVTGHWCSQIFLCSILTRLIQKADFISGIDRMMSLQGNVTLTLCL